MYKLISGLKLSFGYFSIIPISLNHDDKMDDIQTLRYMLFFLPLVGVCISLLAISPYYIVQNSFFAILSASLYMWLSGFLHLEAVIDVVDAIYAKMSGKDAYQVIKEPTVGAIGVLWGVGFFLLKVAGMAFLLLNHRYMDIVAMAVVSRVGVLSLLYMYEFKSSFVTLLKSAICKYSLVFWIVICVKYIYMIFISLYIAFVVGKKLGFKNGDVLGFVLESSEIIYLIIIASLL